MKKYSILIELKNFFKKIFSRFPLSLILAILIFFVSILLIGIYFDFFNLLHAWGIKDIEYLLIFLITIIFIFFFSVGIQLFTEGLKLGKFKSNISQIFSILFGIFLYINFSKIITNHTDSYNEIIFFVLSFIGIILFIFVSLFLRDIFIGNCDQKKYYSFFHKLCVSFVLSLFIGGLLFLLGGLAMWTVEFLFDIHIKRDCLYLYWFAFSIALVTPIIFLHKIPTQKDIIDKPVKINKSSESLVNYILVPFVIFYIIILYAYSGKFLGSFSYLNGPKGAITWIIILFSILGYLVYFVSYPLEQKNSFIKKFRIFLPYIVLPQTLVLFYAIYLRIFQYGLTMNRYFIVIFGIWLVFVSFYYIFSREKFIGFLPVSLLLFVVIISIGPWSIYSLPVSSQLKRLENNLIKIGVLNETTKDILKVKSEDVSNGKIVYDINSQIHYICNFDNCESIADLFEKKYNFEKRGRKFNQHRKIRDIIFD